MESYIEKIDIEKAAYLNKLDNEVLVNSFYQDKFEKDGHPGERIAYVKRIKRFLAKHIINPKGLKVSYKQKIDNIGRSYSLNFSLQTLQSNLRSFLCSEYYNDVDMVNSSPSILYYIAQKYFPQLNTPLLKSYVSKRKKFIKKYKCNKNDIIQLLFTSKETNNFNLKPLDFEIKQLQKLIFEKHIFNINKDSCKKSNIYGSYLCKTLQTLENEIILFVVQDYKDVTSSLIFDGFLINKNIDINLVIEKINEKVSAKYNKYIQFIHKPWILVNHERLETADRQSYDDIKYIFEQKYFYIENPPIFAKTYLDANAEEKLTLLSVGEIKYDTLIYNYDKVSESKNADGFIKTNFFKDWLLDPNKRKYKYLSFFPKIGDYQYYNMFKGFINKPLENYDLSTIDIFLNHLKLLVNDDEPSFNYVLGWLAQLIQKPEEQLQVCLIFKGLQGSGKDTLIELIEKIIGCDAVFKTSKMDDVLGNFNIGLKNKLLILFNEIEGSKSDFANHSKFKDLITLKSCTINEKNKPQYSLQNFARIILFSNSNSPLKVEHSDRRLCVFNTGLPKNKAYYDKLYHNINNEKFISSIHRYLLDYDLSKFNYKDRPKNKVYDAMKNDSINEFIYYFYEFINKVKNNEIDIIDEDDKFFIKKGNIMLIKPDDLLLDYKSYLKETDKETKYNLRDYKSIKLDLINIESIDHKRMRINGIQNTYYKINLNEAIQYLELAYKFEDQEIEDFDIEEYNIPTSEIFETNNNTNNDTNNCNISTKFKSNKETIYYNNHLDFS